MLDYKSLYEIKTHPAHVNFNSLNIKKKKVQKKRKKNRKKGFISFETIQIKIESTLHKFTRNRKTGVMYTHGCKYFNIETNERKTY